MPRSRVLGLVVALVALFALAIGFSTRYKTASAAPGVALARPAFLTAPTVDDVAVVAIGDKLDAEAGISAWVQTSLPIDLDLVRGQFRTIETETADYIIGSVPVPQYNEHFDPHVYVHADGWILAYYLKTDPAAKIVDTRAESVESDKLQGVVANLAALAGTSAQDIAYYDFRFPNATHMLMVEENDDSGYDFNIQLPTGYSYNELSFAVSGYGEIQVDNVDIDTQYNDGNGYGTLTLSQLLPGATHTVELYYVSYGVIVIIHRVP